ncbi:coiled-coil domain-containing protein 120 [Corythoichthys intestinalis]|uniref:coiled-coil domain-containing protein 120 n=1 Tax=Corythoichthys intestinalis TaxID=161448 RepID=UPI0025A61A10|nr:coiled-coil domain-containing protein 120 [Corythoichthys intestinalis]XP_057685956.1 coiled-coil domain-containing protein 120 [Corythoichthys intestinalis]
MEVKGQLISAPAPLTCWDRKQREHMLELQERRRSLQSLLSARLAELRRVCLQEAELTGSLPSDFPLAAGEKLPHVRRRGGTSRQANRKYKVEEEDGARVKTKKTLFSGTRRKHNDREHNTHAQHGKTTVHRGCHTDDTVRWESSSTSDSTGNDNEELVPQSRPLLVAAGSPVEGYYHNKTRTSSVCNRSELPEGIQNHRPSAQPRSHVSSPSARPSESTASAETKASVTARPNNTSEELPEYAASPEKDQQDRSRVSSVTGSQAANSRPTVGRGRGYGDLLLDYVLSKQRQQSQPITSQHPSGAPPTYQVHMGEQRRVKVTRTKSCGPFLPVPQIQPDPHPHLVPPHLSSPQDAHLEGATRSLHKALALEGLRDWYLRNTTGSSQTNQSSGKVKGQMGGAFQRRRTTHSAKHSLSHSITFHGHPLHGRSADGSLYLDSAPSHKQSLHSKRCPRSPLPRHCHATEVNSSERDESDQEMIPFTMFTLKICLFERVTCK